MGATYKTPRSIRPGQSVFIATPAYESIKPGYAYSLATTCAELTRKGIPFEISIMHGNCHVDDGRNELVRQFLHESSCTDLVFLDSDVKWDAKMFLRLIRQDIDDILAGVYPFKSYPQRFPVGKILHIREEPDAERGLLEVSYAPTGFMRIPRRVFEALIPSQTRRGLKDPTYRFFERRYTETTYDGGDVTFCRKWIAHGGKVIVDPTLTLEHIGEHRWVGCFLDYLNKSQENKELHTLKHKDPVPVYKPDHPQERKQEKKAQPVKGTPVGKPDGLEDILTALRAGTATLEHFQKLADAWGNKPWAATPEYLEMVYKMAINLPTGSHILECGSGASTVVLAAVTNKFGMGLTVLEHSDEWQGNIKGWLDRLGLHADFPAPDYSRERQWYDFNPVLNPDFIVIDGPPRYLGADRLYPLKQEWIAQSAVLVDDATSNILAELNSLSGVWVPLQLGKRPACAGRANVTEDEFSHSAA